jgi:hypothetical protein
MEVVKLGQIFFHNQPQSRGWDTETADVSISVQNLNNSKTYQGSSVSHNHDNTHVIQNNTAFMVFNNRDLKKKFHTMFKESNAKQAISMLSNK